MVKSTNEKIKFILRNNLRRHKPWRYFTHNRATTVQIAMRVTMRA